MCLKCVCTVKILIKTIPKQQKSSSSVGKSHQEWQGSISKMYS